MTVRLHLSCKKRRKGAELASRVVTDIAHDTASEDDQFSIVTGSGKRITPEEIRINTKVSVQPNGNSVQRADAYSRLVEYYEHLRSSGVLIE